MARRAVHGCVVPFVAAAAPRFPGDHMSKINWQRLRKPKAVEPAYPSEDQPDVPRSYLMPRRGYVGAAFEIEENPRKAAARELRKANAALAFPGDDRRAARIRAIRHVHRARQLQGLP